MSPQTFVIDAYNPGVDISIPNLSFPSSDVRAASVRYAVHRETDSTEVNETGFIWVVFNDTNGTWDISQEHSDDAQISFNITNIGQMRFTTTALAGLNHSGFITFSAQSLENP